VRGVLAGFSLAAWLLLRTPAGKAADAKEETNCVELGLRVHEAAIRLCVRRARWLPRANRSGENSPNLIDLERQNLDVLVSAMASGTLLASVRIAVQFIAKLRFRFWFSGIALLSNRPVDPAASAERVRAGSGCDQSSARGLLRSGAGGRDLGWLEFCRRAVPYLAALAFFGRAFSR